MAKDPFAVDALYGNWLKMQGDFLKAQEPFWRNMSQNWPTAPEETTEAAEKIWGEARTLGLDWLNTMKDQLGRAGVADEGISGDTLRRMMDPWQFLYAGSDEINQTIQKLVEGPEFSDIGSLERMGLKATREWIALREASAEYRMVTVKSWTRAFETFSEEMLGNKDLWADGPRKVLDRWLEIANEELVRTQRTSEFLRAQRNLLRAGVDYRLREREIVEVWCETHSIPTRSEVDDLHDTVYRLRHEVRALKKEQATVQKPKPRKSTAKKKQSRGE